MKMHELVYGIHAVKSILDICPQQILKVYTVCGPWDSRLKLLLNQINQYYIPVQEYSRKYLTHKTKGAVHQGIVVEIKVSSDLNENFLLNFLKTCNKSSLLLILDNITDPHNLGACLRSADAAGVNIVITPRNRSAHINSTVRKVSSGAVERVPFLQVINLSRTLQLLKKHNIRIFGTVIRSSRVIFNAKFTGALALVMGAEGSGLRQLTKKNCDELIHIPMNKSYASLNVSVATGICLFEILRQRYYQK